MKVLFLSDFYPPASRGGYEQWCQEVLDELRSRGHDVAVLTSGFGKNHLAVPDPTWVHRDLYLEMELASLRNAFQFFVHRKIREKENIAYVTQFVRDFNPDVVMIWGMWNLQRSISALVEAVMAGRVAYYLGDYWPILPNQFESYWQAPARNSLTRVPKLFLKPVAQSILRHEERPELKFEHVLFPTAFMRDEMKRKGVIPLHTRVVYGAIHTTLYPIKLKRQDSQLCLLYVGRLSDEKGVHTAVEAVGHLVREYGFRNLKLTIVGSGEPEYEIYLDRLVERNNLVSIVTFLPAQPKGALPGLYQQADIFLFTSIWAEPFGRVIVEAMASGLAVVGAPVGGAGEILVENENALVFTPNDPVSLAGQLRRLIESQELRDKLGEAGRETAISQFDIRRMTIEIEAYLESLIQ